MILSCIITVVYLVIGLILAMYWFDKDYSESYNAAIAEDMGEKGMASILLIMLMFFWPIKFIKKIFN